MDFKISWKFQLYCFAVFSVLASLFSLGYLHLDEHYQILEFLNLKNTGSMKSIPWEYGAKIRPWIQPFSYFYIFKFLNFFGVESPFVIESILRFLSCLLFFASAFNFNKYFIKEIENRFKSYYILFSTLFWPLPFLSARLSSEVVGGAVFFIGLIGALKHLTKLEVAQSKKTSYTMLFFYSVILGFSVWIRFQLAVMVLGFLLWYLFVSKKANLKSSMAIVFGGSFAIFLNIMIDYWGYGVFTLTPYNYFNSNILEGVAASFGTHPWWEYFYVAQKKLHPVVGIFIVLSFFFFWVVKKTHVLAITSFLFVVLHTVTAHKEFRFLFPLAYMAPLVAMVTFQALAGCCRLERLNRSLKITAISSFFIYQTIFAFAAATRAPYQGVGMLKFLKGHSEITTLYRLNSQPILSMSHWLPQSYYGVFSLKEFEIKALSDLPASNESFIFGRGGREYLLFQSFGCEEVYPKFNFLYKKFHYGKSFYKTDFYSIFKCSIK